MTRTTPRVAGGQQEFRRGAGAARRRLQGLSRPGHRAGRRQRRRQVHAGQVRSPASTIDTGEYLFEGNPVTVHRPKDAAALGIEIVYQDLALCDNLDIVQNMFLGRETQVPRDRARRAVAWRQGHGSTLASLSVRTVKSVRQLVSSLSGGQRQTVAIAKSVLWNSKVVMLDEPTAALGVAQTRQVLDLVRRLADNGLGVVLIWHNMNDVFEVADRISALYLGRVAADVRPPTTSHSQIVELITAGRSGDRLAAADADESA